ncbi:cell death activator CIDE-3 [Micropterus salmoides]|uniref:cell death activator CIDE-3 n=1 Tax=Micropterus salmoides TaxID=27706 RepID=UPI0018ED12B1|nr:cell death activator CIDE-3 [Micropterus salmoides]XP_038553156.1 cell death activator CIDE-3 [Micropterus salmoides]XP_038553157.1 cell death activator CIDE-3 [Micropterus salmoides]XP_038553159.1 cell death activator CIDE-3 [Micropterus salmoides]XP_038553160.1 cell death activator CIDE-3 [Micropterus salmoides]XP_038553161.1 cell death activator CIDE-3 [Micropterus salmoides]
MDYTMKSLSLLTPSTLTKCVTASVSASASMTQQLLSGRAPRPKPFRVTNADRSVKKGIMADTLEDLMNKVADSLSVPCVSALLLDEDGTGVETEDFFQTLPENAVLMVLEKGQKWTPHPNSPSRDQLWPQHRTDVAKLTFDLYKNNPKDFIGCLNVKATLYGVYSVSYDLRCYAAKKMLKEALRWTIFSMQATGHILLGSSCYIEQLLEEEERAEKSLKLPQESKIRQLQSMLLGKTSQ